MGEAAANSFAAVFVIRKKILHLRSFAAEILQLLILSLRAAKAKGPPLKAALWQTESQRPQGSRRSRYMSVEPAAVNDWPPKSPVPWKKPVDTT
jgi:hypothetical protein